MGAAVDYLLEDKKTGRLSFRRVYPGPLRQHIPGHPRELKRSLAATSIKAPGAVERYRKADAEYEAILAKAQKAAAGIVDELGAARIAWLMESYVHGRLAQDEESRFDTDDARFELEALPSFRAAPMGFMDGASRREKALVGLPIVIADLMDAYGSGDAPRIIQIEGQTAEDLSSAHGLRVDPKSQGFATLCTRLIAADIDLARKLLARFQGEPVPTPVAPLPLPEPVAPIVTGVNQSASPAKSFVAVANALMDNPRLAITVMMKESYNTALRFWREVHGDVAPEEITRASVSHWLDLLVLRPSRLPQSERGLPLPVLATKYAGRKDVPRIGQLTIRQHIGSLATVWTKCQGEGLISDNLANPFPRKKISTPKVRREREKTFTLAELQAIFALPVFTEGERPTRGKGEASYWIPLMLLWTGARPEEIAQLLVSDIFQNKENDRWTLRITDEGEHPHKGARRLKTSEKGTGEREFPIPTALIDLGLLQYVASVKRARETALFPRLRTKGKRNLLFAGFSEWWSAYLNAHGVIPQGQGREPAREFRHTWATFARASGIRREASEYIKGHTPSGSSAHEFYGSKVPLGLEIDRLDFARLDLSGVRPWKPS